MRKETLHEFLNRCLEPVIDGYGFKTPSQANDEQKLPLSWFYAIVLFGLGGFIPGLAVGIVGYVMGDWFKEHTLIVQIPAKVLVAAIIGLIAAFIAGTVSGGIIGFILTKLSDDPGKPTKMGFSNPIKQTAMTVGMGVGFFVGVVGGPICVFLDWPLSLIVGSVFGPLFSLTFAFVAMYSQKGGR